MLTQFIQADNAFELFDEFNFDQIPGWTVRFAFGIKMDMVLIEGGWVRPGSTGHLQNSGDTGNIAIGMIKKSQITRPHIIADKISGLIVSDAIPRLGLAWSFFQISNAENVWFGF